MNIINQRDEKHTTLTKIAIFAPGSTIFKEGDLSQEAYRIIKGRVELTATADEKPVILAQIGEGDIFGEMAMIDERPRSASAQCLEQTECEIMAPQDFQSTLLTQPERSIPYLSALFERLRSVSNRLHHEMSLKAQIREATLENVPQHDRTPISYPSPNILNPHMETNAPATATVSTVILTPMTPVCSSKMPEGYEAMQLAKFPFCIGRKMYSPPHQPEIFSANDFEISDNLPFQVSRNHCSIEREGDRYFVRDRGSTLGTIVNGVPLGVKSERLILDLFPGTNELVVGSKNSPYIFQIDLI